MHIHAFRLTPGQDLKRSLQSFVEQAGIEAGWVLTCVGSLTDYHLRFANQATGSHGQGHFEIVSLVGTVSLHGSHLHLSLSDTTGRTLGGHLLDHNRIYTTAEVVLGSSPELRFTREHDGSTPYRELRVSRR